MNMDQEKKNPTRLVFGVIPSGGDGYTLCFMEEERALYLAGLGQVLHSSKTWGELLSRMPAEELEAVEGWCESCCGDPPDLDTPFDPGDIGSYCDGDWPEWPVQSMLEWMPPDIVSKYGEIQRTMLNGDFLTIRPKFTPHVVAALRGHGYLVKKDNNLVRRAQATDPEFYCSYDYSS